MRIIPGLAAACTLALTSLAQGPLVPPGPPAATMKSLDQVEPRTLVSAVHTPGDAASTFIISQPGSYYLGANLVGEAGKHGISIQAHNVTLDLGGFELDGGLSGLHGVDVPIAVSGLEIRHGAVRGWTAGGVRADSAQVLAEKLRLRDNGVAGLSVGVGSLIKDCVAQANAVGFRAGDRSQLTGCVSTGNTSHGFEVTASATLLDCTASGNGGHGFFAGAAATCQRCSATRNDLAGFVFGNGSTISDCTSGSNLREGFFGNRSVLARCNADSNGAAGGGTILAGFLLSGCSVSHCNASNNAANGLEAASSTVTGCMATGNGLNGITATAGSVTNSVAFNNRAHGISVVSGVVAFCSALANNASNGGFTDIVAPGSNRTGNQPTP